MSWIFSRMKNWIEELPKDIKDELSVATMMPWNTNAGNQKISPSDIKVKNY